MRERRGGCIREVSAALERCIRQRPWTRRRRCNCSHSRAAMPPIGGPEPTSGRRRPWLPPASSCTAGPSHAIPLPSFPARHSRFASFVGSVHDDHNDERYPNQLLFMARFALLALLAAAVASAVAATVDEQVVFPGTPSDKKWEWKDCGKLFPGRSLLSVLPPSSS